MINFLHNYTPERIIMNIGPLVIYWYGVLIVAGIITGLVVALRLGKTYFIKEKDMIDLAFWLVLAGVAGARIYHVMIEFEYYFYRPMEIFKLWQGGLAIHGALITDIIILLIFCRTRRVGFWVMASILAPAVAIGQAVGRWGNYFNQELYGKPTSLPWGIPISTDMRLPGYESSSYFHPTFIYESVGSILIFFGLLLLHKHMIKHGKNMYAEIVLAYTGAYSLLRLITESLRVDETANIINMRLPQFISLLGVLISVVGIMYIIAQKRLALEKRHI